MYFPNGHPESASSADNSAVRWVVKRPQTLSQMLNLERVRCQNLQYLPRKINPPDRESTVLSNVQPIPAYGRALPEVRHWLLTTWNESARVNSLKQHTMSHQFIKTTGQFEIYLQVKGKHSLIYSQKPPLTIT